MNAILNSAAVSAPATVNPNNVWRKAVTQEAINDIQAGKNPDLTPFQSFPWNEKDDDRAEKSFGLGSLKHTREYLLSDTRDLDKMRSRLEWLKNCKGKLSWMESKLDAGAGATARSAVLKLKNALQVAVFTKRAYKGTDAETISTLALSVEQASDAVRTGAREAYEAAIASNPSYSDLRMKIGGLKEAIAKAGDIDAAIKKIDHDGSLISAKRKLAGLLEPIIAERETQLAAQRQAKAEAEAEVEAIMASAIPQAVETILTACAPAQRKIKGPVVKAPAKARGEITTKSLEDLGSALVHRQVAEVKAVRCTKADAIDLSGLPEDLFEERASQAEIAGEEEVLTSTAAKAVVLVRRIGNTRRFFVKQAA